MCEEEDGDLVSRNWGRGGISCLRAFVSEGFRRMSITTRSMHGISKEVLNWTTIGLMEDMYLH